MLWIIIIYACAVAVALQMFRQSGKEMEYEGENRRDFEQGAEG